MEASAALAMVSSTKSFQFSEELLVESEFVTFFWSEFEFWGQVQQRQGRWLRAATEFDVDVGLHLEVDVGLHVEVGGGVDSDVSYSDSSSGMRRVRSVCFCFT